MAILNGPRQKQHLTLFGKRQTAEDGLQARRTYQFQVSHVVEFALGLQTLATSPDLVGKGSRKYVCQGFLKVGCMAKNLASASWQQRTRWALASVHLICGWEASKNEERDRLDLTSYPFRNGVEGAILGCLGVQFGNQYPVSSCFRKKLECLQFRSSDLAQPWWDFS